MSKFQIILLAVFGVFIVIAVILFAGRRGSGPGSINLTVWGSLDAHDWSQLMTNSGLDKSETLSFTYSEKPADKISDQFTEALAVGKGPDLIIIPTEDLLKEKNKLLLIPSQSVRPADLASTFIKEGELFQTSLGTYALPMYVDPLVMYWNRDLLTRSSFAVPPVYWDQIYTYISKLTTKDGAGNIITTAMALGEAKNIPHAKEIVSLLMLQAGTPIVAQSGTQLRAVILDNTSNASTLPALSALEFYTQFANPEKSYYSWNRSQVTADTHFTSGKSAMYLGFASELPILKAKNPTQDIAVAPVPQSRTSSKVITFGKLYGVAIARSAKNPTSALSGALALVAKATATALGSATPLVPARRDILSMPPTDPAGFTFYSAGLQSSGWLDPDPIKSTKIFSDMVESVTSGRTRIDEALRTTSIALDALIKGTE